jgi:hypothetical protein
MNKSKGLAQSYKMAAWSMVDDITVALIGAVHDAKQARGLLRTAPLRVYLLVAIASHQLFI